MFARKQKNKSDRMTVMFYFTPLSQSQMHQLISSFESKMQKIYA